MLAELFAIGYWIFDLMTDIKALEQFYRRGRDMVKNSKFKKDIKKIYY